MTFRPILLPMLVASLLVCVQATEAEPKAKTWQEAARENGLSADSISCLEKNRLLITNDAYKQVFSVYLSGKNPLFITSDSLLNAYHVLYEESILRLENAMALRLPPILRLVLKNIEGADDHLRGNPALVAAAKRRAVIVTAIALRLMDDSFRLKDDKLDKILTEEAGLIKKAEGVRMPAWLDKPDDSFRGLDYSRYKPRGFYTRSERLKRYFRAASWLQSIPFRVKKDEELLAMLMLGNCVTYSKFDDVAERRETEAFFRAYRSFIGAGDDWDLMTAAHEAQNELQMDLNGDDLQEKRAWLMKKAKGHGEGPQINDQIRFAPEDPKIVAEPTFRIISAYRTPSAVLFQRTTDLRRLNRPYPDGLEVSIAFGSEFAQESLRCPQKAKVLKTIDSCRSYFRGSSLYLRYLNTLKALVDEPENDAPDFMKNEAWGVKSCNTVLAGWAQLRHTWALQAKQNVYYLCASMVPEGFVEPEPDFFSRMAELAASTHKLLSQSGAFKPDYEAAVRSIDKLKGILSEMEAEFSSNRIERKSHMRPGSQPLRKFDIYRNLSPVDLMTIRLPLRLMEMNKTEAKKGSADYLKEQREWLDTLESDIREGRMDRHPKLKEIVKMYDYDLERLWERLEKASRKLEVISHKQLRDRDLSESEIYFIKGYGKTIAHIMLYGGNSYATPRDNAPRVVDVYANPQEGGYLHVGIARPRKMYVLYPWKGETILCEGAVMPYYEFVTTTRLTDESWRKELDSKNRPSIPKWMSSVVTGGDLTKPSLKEDH